MVRKTLAIAAAAGVAASLAGAAQARDQIRIVGSSPVFPFSTAVAEQFGITSAEILSASQERRIAWPRFACMVLGHEIAGLSSKEIGRRLGRDRSSVEHGFRTLPEIVKRHGDIDQAMRVLAPRCRTELADDAACWTLRQRALDLFNELAEGVVAHDEVELIQQVARLAAGPEAAAEPPWGFGPPAPPSADPSGDAAGPPRPLPLFGRMGESDWAATALSTAERLETMNTTHLSQVLAAGGFGGTHA